MRTICEGIYEEKLPLHSRYVSVRNLYVIKGDARSLMVDTSYREPESMEAIDKMLGELGIPYGQLDVFITHDHPDHSGLVPDMIERGATIYMNPEEAETKRSMVYCYLLKEPERREKLRMVGVCEELEPEVYQDMMGYLEIMEQQSTEAVRFPFVPVHPGDKLKYGGYTLEVTDLCGHTYGQCGLYEPENKLYFCGDQIMTDIVPLVGSQQKDMHMLKRYLDSLRELKHKYGDCRFLSCHGGDITDIGAEVDRVVTGYLNKCEQIREILQEHGGEMTTRAVGVKAYHRSNQTPDFGHFYSCLLIWGKTFSCLDYLYEQGFIGREEKNGTLYWRVKS